MSTGILSSDGATKFVIAENGTTHISLGGSFGGGTVSVNKKVNGNDFPVYDSGVAITATAADDIILQLSQGDKVGLTLAGSTTPSLTWSIT